MSIELVANQLENVFDQQTLSPDNVVKFYRGVDSVNPRQDVVDMINLYSSWQLMRLRIEDLGRLNWFFSNDPNHISWYLTSAGKKRSTLDVAKRFLDSDRVLIDWDRSQDIYQMVDLLKNGKSLPPLIIIEGSRYPNSPESSYIDGIHRGLAYQVYKLLYPNFGNDTIDTFVGRKAPLIGRLSRKLTSILH